MEKRIGDLERKVEKGLKVREGEGKRLEQKIKVLETGSRRGYDGERGGEVEKRDRNLEREAERKERLQGRNNIIIKGFREVKEYAKKK